MLNTHHLLGSVVVAATLASSIHSQGQMNVHALGRFAPIDDYIDIWGYVAPNGDEYAILGTVTGTHIIDCTNPRDPQQRGFIPGPSSGWRDFRSYSTYVYAGTEGGGGFQVIDMSNPNSPTLLRTVGATEFRNSHNLCVDLGTGRLYCCGTNAGTVVYDAATNPANPSLVGIYNGPYLHDLHVHNGIGFGSAINSGFLHILDVTTWPLTLLSNTATPLNFTHNAWTNTSNTLCVTTDERSGAVIQFYDVSNPAAPIARGSFTPDPSSAPHNAFIVGDRCHVAWYTEGYRVIDVSNPNNPTEIGYFDTCTNISTGGFDGAWGCYPFQPSGYVYVSDRSGGLWVLQYNEMGINHTRLDDIETTSGTYPVTASVTSPDPISSVTLEWSTDGQTFTTAAMTPTGTANEFGGGIPAQPTGTEVWYRVVAENTTGIVQEPELGSNRFTVNAPNQVFFDDFEADRGWTHAAIATQDDWHRDTPNGATGSSWQDPSAAFSGLYCWGNDLGHCTFGGSYASNVSNYLESPPIPTRGISGLHLRFRRWLQVASGDTASISINGTDVFSSTGSINDPNWTLQDIDISSVANGAASLTIRFSLVSDGGVQYGGWNIDDVELVATDPCWWQVYGAGTAGSGGFVPSITTSTGAQIGSSLQVDGTDMLGGAPAALILSPLADSVAVFGINILVELSLATTLATPVGGTPGTPGAGTATVNLSVPNDPAIVGNDYRFQWLIGDAGGVGGFLSASPGMRVRFCP